MEVRQAFLRQVQMLDSPPADSLSDLGYRPFLDQLGLPQNLTDVLTVFRLLTPDGYLRTNIALFEAKRAGQGRFWEMCCALNLFARLFKPTRYLEIGVRRGRSLAQVAYYCPDCELIGIDLWVPEYAGEENPGPQFVEGELRKLGFRGPLTLITGDSHKTLSRFLQERRVLFSLITVDGDHSAKGAWTDLQNVAEWIAVGGMLVFDDISHERHQLAKAWGWFKKKYATRFFCIENLGDMHGTALAVRTT